MNGLGRWRVLVADDDADMRALIVAALRADGYQVTEVRDGCEAADYIAGPMLFGDAGAPPDLIVTDVRMPGITGLSLIAGIRAHGWSTPIIMITAYDVEATRPDAERLGAVLFAKPFDVDDLRTAVLNLLHKHAKSGTHRIDLPAALRKQGG
jgi:CheY-like chemotaxis protein